MLSSNLRNFPFPSSFSSSSFFLHPTYPCPSPFILLSILPSHHHYSLPHSLHLLSSPSPLTVSLTASIIFFLLLSFLAILSSFRCLSFHLLILYHSSSSSSSNPATSPPQSGRWAGEEPSPFRKPTNTILRSHSGHILPSDHHHHHALPSSFPPSYLLLVFNL